MLASAVIARAYWFFIVRVFAVVAVFLPRLCRLLLFFVVSLHLLTSFRL
jgi:hypothetical protein